MIMNSIKAKKILGFEIYENITIKDIKKKYKMAALIHHPDKNPNENANEIFIEIQEAYQYLLSGFKNTETEDETEDETETNGEPLYNYFSLFTSVLTNILEENGIDLYQTQIFHNIIFKVTQLCETKSLEILEKIDKNILIKIYKILNNYSSIFKVSPSILNKILGIIENKIKNDENIIINPLIDDLLHDNLFHYHYKNCELIIPLWHHEIIYDISGVNVCFSCFPVLPENVWINNENHLFVNVFYNIQEVLHKTELEIVLGKQIFKIKTDLLHIAPTQQFTLRNMGISLIDTENIYNISKRGNITVIIHLE